MYAMRAIRTLREAGIKAELYPDAAKIAKQFQHADKRGIPFAVLTGEEEISSSMYTLKNLATGEQQKVDINGLLSQLQ
jgi:histidyl-tRNA synthetase